MIYIIYGGQQQIWKVHIHIIQLFLLSCFLNNKCLWWYMCMGMKVANTVEKVQSPFHSQQVQKKKFCNDY